MGRLDDAVPVFARTEHLPGAGVLLAVPALVASGVLFAARKIYGSLGPAFYGLRTTLVAYVLLAFLRIPRPETLKEHAPGDVGRIIGLDRILEVKTLRRKHGQLAVKMRSHELGRGMARRRIAERGRILGVLYVDGHVRAYHGKRKIARTYLTRARTAGPGTTDYWIRSPQLFQNILAMGIDILTYRKGRFRRVAERRFVLRKARLAGRPVESPIPQPGEKAASFPSGYVRSSGVVRAGCFVPRQEQTRPAHSRTATADTAGRPVDRAPTSSDATCKNNPSEGVSAMPVAIDRMRGVSAEPMEWGRQQPMLIVARDPPEYTAGIHRASRRRTGGRGAARLDR
jgi:prepilin-type processing-associated H-X9-DG protein